MPTIDGRAKIRIEAGTQPGKMLRLRNKGLPSVNGYGTGDQLVNVNVYIPESIDAKDEQAIAAMENSDSFKPTDAARKDIDKKYREMLD